MASPRSLAILPLLVVLGEATDARSRCATQEVALPAMCAGAPATATVRLCFAPDAGCDASGTVLGLTPPSAPFSIDGLHVEGPLGSRDVGVGDFPIGLAVGETLVADVSAVLTGPGDASGSLVWIVGSTPVPAPIPMRHDPQPPVTDSCEVDLSASTPRCEPPDPGNPCSGQVCVGGTCVSSAAGGPCDDGDPCTVGDTCQDGVCQPGTPLDCGGDACTVGATCVDGRCTGGTPVSCDDGDPCTVDRCDPTSGCVHERDPSCPSADPCNPVRCGKHGCVKVPVTGPSCDDGDACTTADRCVAGRCVGTPIRCSDGIACTDDRCVDGACQHVAVDARCDSGECVVGTCRPGAAGADRDGCLTVSVGEGEPCTDDGIACTEDVCMGGACLHMPVDSRCGSSSDCTAAVCAPERPDRDSAGCAPAPAPAEGAVCAEDGDPCTNDLCQGGRCVHQPVADLAACTPIDDAFEKALGLTELAHGIASAIAPDGAGQGTDVGAAIDARLGRVADALDGAVQALAGRTAAASAVAPLVPGLAETPAELRAHIAFTHVLRTPTEVQSFLQVVASAEARAELGRDATRSARRRGRMLLMGTKSLKGELRRLQQVSQTFAR